MNIDKSSNLANFYLELLDFKDKQISFNVKSDITKEVKKSWQKGIPLLSNLQPEIKPELFKKALLAIAQAYHKWQPGTEPLHEDTISKMEKLESQEIALLIKKALNNPKKETKEFLAKLDISESLFEFLLENSTKPFLQTFAMEVSKEINIKSWTKGYCPICGKSPSMARLTKENGSRELFCSHCETVWSFPRIGCPFCGNEDTSKISFLKSDEYPQYRLYLCDHCKGYLKTVDEREYSETDLFCEELATKDFDKLAKEEGYNVQGHRDTPN